MRVLALDGGGARGLIQAQYLREIEDILNEVTGSEKPKPIGEFFDLVVGTSVGGIAALAISDGMHASDLSNFIDSCLDTVFPRKRFKLLRSAFRPIYKSEALRGILQDHFGSKTLGQLGEKGPHVVVVAHNPEMRTARLFKSAYEQRFAKHAASTSVVEVALASAAAPTYFPSVRVSTPKGAQELLDGGLVANNPSLVGLAELAKHRSGSHNTNFADGIASFVPGIAVLSVGTGTSQWNSRAGQAGMNGAGWIWWARKLHEQVLAAQAIHAEYIISHLCSHSDYVRVSGILNRECEVDSVNEARKAAAAAKLTGDQHAAVARWGKVPWSRRLPVTDLD